MQINKKTERLLQIVSYAIPVAVAVILGIRNKIYLGDWTKQLTHLIGILNASTAIVLCLGFYFIKNKNYAAHKTMMSTAFYMGAVFLILYIIYHISNENTPSTGMLSGTRYLYLFFLISHIILSIVVVRYVLFSIYYALTKQIEKHKAMVKITFPLWLYVSVSGVIVYLMISPYYV